MSGITETNETVGISEVIKYDRNPRRHPEAQINELIRSLSEFGQYRDLLVDEGGVILAGNGLHEAMLRAGYETVKVRRISGLTDEQKIKLVLTDNRTSDLSTDDFDIVEKLLSELSDFDVPGYDPHMVEELMASAEALTAEAQNYGSVDPEVIDLLQSKEAEVAEENAQATVGVPPAPPSPPSPEPTGPVSVEAEKAQEAGDVCPSCGRAW